MYDIAILHVYTLQCDHQGMSSNHLSQNTVVIIDYIPCVVHYIPVTHLFYNWRLVSLIPIHLFTRSSPLCPLAIISLFSVFMSLFLFCFVCLSYFFCLDPTYKWNYTVFVFVWVILFSITPSNSSDFIHIGISCKILWFLLNNNIPIYVYM